MCDFDCKWRNPDGECKYRAHPVLVPHNAPCMLHPVTHRCEGLLGQNLSIRLQMASGNWVLRHRQYDFDWDDVYMENVGAIRYCPCCGTELVRIS